MGNLKEFISKVLPRRPTTGAGSASSSSQAVFRDGQNRKEVLAMPMDAAFKLVHKFLVKDLGPLLDAAEPVPDTSAAAMEADAVESGTGELHDVLAGTATSAAASAAGAEGSAAEQLPHGLAGGKKKRNKRKKRQDLDQVTNDLLDTFGVAMLEVIRAAAGLYKEHSGKISYAQWKRWPYCFLAGGLRGICVLNSSNTKWIPSVKDSITKEYPRCKCCLGEWNPDKNKDPGEGNQQGKGKKARAPVLSRKSTPLARSHAISVFLLMWVTGAARPGAKVDNDTLIVFDPAPVIAALRKSTRVPASVLDPFIKWLVDNRPGNYRGGPLGGREPGTAAKEGEGGSSSDGSDSEENTEGVSKTAGKGKSAAASAAGAKESAGGKGKSAATSAAGAKESAGAAAPKRYQAIVPGPPTPELFLVAIEGVGQVSIRVPPGQKSGDPIQFWYPSQNTVNNVPLSSMGTPDGGIPPEKEGPGNKRKTADKPSEEEEQPLPRERDRGPPPRSSIEGYK
ncbi:hypothetical protein T484DRAFT_1966630 [Baffinella frigidus]|nr:hypothetical protein T484DRAFT_1966630 [Cryptophyta sp. CCMP2293]